MPGVSGVLSRFLRGPATVATIPSGSGMVAFRDLQKQALQNYAHEELLTDHARRLRNRLVVGLSAVAIGAAVIAGGASAPTRVEAGESAVVQTEIDQQVEHALDRLERAATEMFFIKTSGAGSHQTESARNNVLAMANGVYGELRMAAVAGNDQALENGRRRLAEMNQSDLGKMGVDFMKEAFPRDMVVTGQPAKLAVAKPKHKSVAPGV